MQATITITDADRSVDYTLEVAGDVLAGSPCRRGWRDGGEPGEAPAVEIRFVRCLEMAIWCGKHAVSALPGGDPRESLEARIGAWCLDKYAEEIEEALLDAYRKRLEAAREPLSD